MNVVSIEVHDAGGSVYAYDVRSSPPRMILGFDVQPGESREDAVHAVVDAVRDRLLGVVNDPTGDPVTGTG